VDALGEPRLERLDRRHGDVLESLLAELGQEVDVAFWMARPGFEPGRDGL
jgi:hypothetical protein